MKTNMVRLQPFALPFARGLCQNTEVEMIFKRLELQCIFPHPLRWVPPMLSIALGCKQLSRAHIHTTIAGISDDVDAVLYFLGLVMRFGRPPSMSVSASRLISTEGPFPKKVAPVRTMQAACHAHYKGYTQPILIKPPTNVKGKAFVCT